MLACSSGGLRDAWLNNTASRPTMTYRLTALNIAVKGLANDQPSLSLHAHRVRRAR